MYQALLTRRYLLSKVMPLLASLAVALCTAMVIIVWSVMGGFLNMLLASGKTMIGDVSITWPLTGLAHYEDLIDRLEADPMVHAATPTIEALALLGLPGGEVRTVQVIGIEPEGYHEVTGYYDRLWWRPIEEPLPRDKDRRDIRLDPQYRERLQRALEEGQALEVAPAGDGAPEPAVVPGCEVSRFNVRTPEGFLLPAYHGFLPNEEVTISVLPLSRAGAPLPKVDRRLPVANEFRTGLYEADANWVLVPFGILQQMLAMDRARRAPEGWQPGAVEIDERGVERPVEPPPAGIEPARATHVLVRAAPAVSADALAERCREMYADFAAAHAEEVPPPARMTRLIYTWERKPGLETFIQAVKKETALVLVLFAFISLTAVFLVFAIFWAMISEKTRDVGVLRALGASRAGVAWLFLRYGAAIGGVGSLLGGALAWVIVTNINPIHEWMGRALGISIWDPAVYYFSEVPNTVEWDKAIIVLIAGVLSCVLGALIPAVRAANMDPVRALRFE